MGSTYHYRIVGENNAGKDYGSDVTFTTSPLAPSATTDPATSVDSDSAVLNGTVNPNGADTTCYFEYGTTTSYGSTTAVVSAGSGSGNVSVSSSISRLELATTYHYRLVAVNTVGTTNGLDQAFTTNSLAPSATTQPATSITTDSAVLNGTVDPNASPTTYYFEYGVSTAYGSTTLLTSAGSGGEDVSVNAAVSGLNSGTTYHARIFARNATGESYGDDVVFTTASDADPIVSTAAISSITRNSASSGGNVISDGGAPVTARGVCWNTKVNPTVSNNKTTDGTGTGSFTSSLTGLIPGTTYHIRAYVTNALGTSYGIDISFTTFYASILYVNSDGICGGKTPCYSKIQEGIDAAPDGSEILVHQGTYNESISLTSGKTVVVKGGYNSTYSQQTDNATFVYGQTIQAYSGSLKYQMLSILLQPGNTWTDPVTGMVFVRVEGGCYEMGCGDWTDSCYDNELPVHEVCVNGFWMGKYEVTQGQWQQIMGSNPSYFDYGDNYPVERVSWDDCQEFIDDLNSERGSVFRLPTEAEWEYAARSGGRKEKYAGGDDLDSLGWYEANSGDQTHEVGTKVANGLGIYDMSGNVYEWCQDWYAFEYYDDSPTDNPPGPSTGSNRVFRGGSCYDGAGDCRSANRIRFTPGYRYDDLDFRLAFSAGQ